MYFYVSQKVYSVKQGVVPEIDVRFVVPVYFKMLCFTTGI